MEERPKELSQRPINTFERIVFLCLIIALVALSASAQTQQGYVKTRGRLVNGSVVAGQRLSGVTVHIKGRNAVVSKANGTFSFPVPANRFVVQSVKKQGYVLVDPEVTARQYSYSSDPLIFVLETPSQLTEDKLANERKIRRTLQRQLEAKEDEIEALKEQNKITEDEYHKALQELYALQESNEKLISEMAERYSQIDYDQLDEFNQRISDCILNGRLTEADSLLRSKGDMKSRIAAIHQEEKIEAAEAAELAKRQENLEKIKAGTKASKEDVARDCYSFYERFLTEHQNDSAAYYLELRASLDTTNVEWLNELGLFYIDYLADCSQAYKIFQQGLHYAIEKYAYQNELLASCYTNIGGLSSFQNDFETSLEYYQKSLSILEDVLGNEHPHTALLYNNIGVVYSELGNYAKALDYYNKSLMIRQKVLGTDHPDVAISFYSIGSLYHQQEHDVEALSYYQEALSILEQNFGQIHPWVAEVVNSIGGIYSDQKDKCKALEYYQRALSIRQQVFGNNHPSISNSYNNIATIYYYQGDFVKAIEYFHMALSIRQQVLGRNHPKVASLYNNIASVYDSQTDYTKADDYYQAALEIQIRTLPINHPSIARTYSNLGVLYENKEDYSMAYDYFVKAYNIYLDLYGQEGVKTVRVKEKIDSIMTKIKP